MTIYNDKYNLDTPVNRKNTDCLKYDFAQERIGREDVLPLWIADMDFQLPPDIIAGIQKTVSLGIFGYTDTKDDYFQSVHNWFLKQHHWSIEKEWIVKSPGVVFAIALALQAFTKEGDAVLIQQPVYYPFAECILTNKRKLVNSQLVYKDNSYSIDFEDFENKIVTEHVKLFILCNPQNPTGRVFTKMELQTLGTICNKHKVLVVADEIHCDFTYPGATHIPYATLGTDYQQNVIVCTSPSKSFNIAGLQVANIVIPNTNIRKTFTKAFQASGYSQLNTVGLTACKEVYNKGQEWLQEVKTYVYQNLVYLQNYLETYLPEVKLILPEGTYLVWLDFSGLGLTASALETLILDKAKLWLDSGSIFGPQTEQFQRINIACARATLQQALEQLRKAINSL